MIMPLPRSTRVLLGVVLGLLWACSSATDATNIADPTLDFDSAQIRWTTSHPSTYSFEVITYTAMLPSSGFYHVEVTDNRVATVRSDSTGALVAASFGFTVDELWARLNWARGQGDGVSSLRFSREGVPIQAMTGSFANDGGVYYELRNFVPHL